MDLVDPDLNTTARADLFSQINIFGLFGPLLGPLVPQIGLVWSGKRSKLAGPNVLYTDPTLIQPYEANLDHQG